MYQVMYHNLDSAQAINERYLITNRIRYNQWFTNIKKWLTFDTSVISFVKEVAKVINYMKRNKLKSQSQWKYELTFFNKSSHAHHPTIISWSKSFDEHMHIALNSYMVHLKNEVSSRHKVASQIYDKLSAKYPKTVNSILTFTCWEQWFADLNESSQALLVSISNKLIYILFQVSFMSNFDQCLDNANTHIQNCQRMKKMSFKHNKSTTLFISRHVFYAWNLAYKCSNDKGQQTLILTQLSWVPSSNYPIFISLIMYFIPFTAYSCSVCSFWKPK